MDGYLVGMHRDLHIRKVLQATISSAEFLSIPTTTKFTKAVKYISIYKSWERFYVLLDILFPCLRVLRLAVSNLARMEKFYHYSRMTKQCIEKKNQVLTIREFLLTYHHYPICGTLLMIKVMKKSQHQRIQFCVLKIIVLSYPDCGIKGRNISIHIML